MTLLATFFDIKWLESGLAGIPLPLLEVWGRVGYLLGLALAICAFSGFTVRPGGAWGLGRQRQAWDAQAFVSIPLTFVLIVVSGYVGSFVVLVPGAQTFESLKDLFVFLCIVLFGYPALVAVPFAYGLSDLIEGVPPAFLADWLEGYFINPACFWVAHQLFGKDPDFLRVATWGKYLLFVMIFLAIEPVLWGYICSGRFTSEISYGTITPALFFTTGITWLIAPFAMLGALPVARGLGLFWAEIPGHAQERVLGRRDWIWVSGGRGATGAAPAAGHGLPIRMFLLAPFIVFVAVTLGATAYVILSAAGRDAQSLASRLHQETAENIGLQLDAYLARSPRAAAAERTGDLAGMLRDLPIAQHGRAFILDRSGKILASSAEAGDPIVEGSISGLYRALGDLEAFRSSFEFRFDHVAAKPLSSEAWLAQASSYQGGQELGDWILTTAMPEAYYMAGLRTGQSRSAMVFAVALLLSLAVAALLASIVAAPLRRISTATMALAAGDLAQRLPRNRLEELDALSQSFNAMAEKLKGSFDELRGEVAARKSRERELEESEARARASEHRLQLAAKAVTLGTWDWDPVRDELVWDDSMYRLHGIRKQDFRSARDAWSRCLAAEDLARAESGIRAALRGDRELDLELRVRRGDGTVRTMRVAARPVRGRNGEPLRLLGISWDVTDESNAE